MRPYTLRQRAAIAMGKKLVLRGNQYIETTANGTEFAYPLGLLNLEPYAEKLEADCRDLLDACEAAKDYLLMFEGFPVEGRLLLILQGVIAKAKGEKI